jgi:hypothetical protein
MNDFALPNYTVYFDANPAFSPKPNEPISAGFLQALTQVCRLTNAVVKVPSIVIQELWYQKTHAALQAAENQRRNAETIKQICGIAPTQIPDFQHLKLGCKKRLDECLGKNAIAVIDVPVQKVDWHRVIESACWRLAPFEKPKSSDDLAEKGFRDCLIIESIVHDAAEVKEGNIAVLSKDKMFTSGLKARASHVTRPLEMYDGCLALLSQLRLENETKSGQFAAAVLEKVGAVFYNPDNPMCVVSEHKLLEKLRDGYDAALSQPTIFSLLKPGQATTSGDWLSEITEWSPVSDLKISAAAPEFTTVAEQGDEHGRYHWRSELTLARLLRRSRPASRHYAALPDEKIRLQKIAVLWSADVDPSNAEFSNTRIDGLDPIFSDDFIEPTWELRRSFGFPMIPGMDPE